MSVGPWLLWAVLAVPSGAELGAAPSTQSLIYYNARLALREGRAAEASKLWLLRTAVAAETQRVSPHDRDFRSLIWAALGQQGLCPDGLPADADGVGLWPVALHNWLLRNRRPAPPEPEGSPLEALQYGRQQRAVSVHDVLDAAEFEALSFARWWCWWGYSLAAQHGWPWSDLGEPDLAARTLRTLLRRGLKTLRTERVVGRAALLARLFDLNVRIASLDARQARRALRDQVRDARDRGASRAEITALRAQTPDAAGFDAESQRILTDSLRWAPEEWLTLSADRRAALFAEAAARTDDEAQVRAAALGILDLLIDAGRGGEVMGWIAHASGRDPASQQAIWAGDRGRRLLSLDPSSGFTERGTIALHRGVHTLRSGALPQALRDLAYALQWAEGGREAEAVRGLARRWLSFVAARFRVTDALLATLRTVAPPRDFAAILEDQLWQAAFSADADSFARCVRDQPRRGALTQRSRRLEPLAQGDVGGFIAALRPELEERPHAVLRFLDGLLDRLQAQDADLRARHAPLLTGLIAELTARLGADPRRREGRALAALIERLRATHDSLGALADDGSPEARARSLAPGRSVFVGSVRVAPSDALPWPFTPPSAQPPSVFLPLVLRPEEWRAPDGALVFGWRIHEP